MRLIGDGVLAQKAAPVERIDNSTIDLANDMLAAMRARNGIGLAAPQIGVSLRMVVIDVPFDEDEKHNGADDEAILASMPLLLVNPKIIALSGAFVERDEGCLSIPGLYLPVIRQDIVRVSFQDARGKNIEAACSGLLGRCTQHEVDHLDGILFVDRLSPETASGAAGRLNEVKRDAERRGFRIHCAGK
ncbi:MAG: peptide deformylase [Victivallaceae bacterium]|nr:peptide deformylase [Victivallaceae bacterium]